MDAESQVQRRIELQSPEDLSYLIANVRTAAAVRLNEAFPLVEGQEGEDELRNSIEALVNAYIDKTFTLASPNLSINGLPVQGTYLSGKSSSPSTAYEPFDARKRQRVADLVTQEEKLLEEVASLKRSVPARAAAEHAQSLQASLRRDEELAAAVARVGHDEGRIDAVGRLERQEDVERGFRGAVEGLGRLRGELSSVVAKMERARVAGEYCVGGDKA